MNRTRRKIFISAYACEPYKGSEGGIGWNIVNELAKYYDVHVLTRTNNREVIERYYAENLSVSRPFFHYYDIPRWLSFWKKKRRGYRFYYYLWQYGAYFQYKKFVNTFGFDIVQHLTFANFATPSLFMACNAVTIWGPIGNIPVPENIFRALPFKIKLKEMLRKYIRLFLMNLDPMRLKTLRVADYILEYEENPCKSFPKKYYKKIYFHSQTGINTSEAFYHNRTKCLPDGKKRLLICSEFMHWKGCVWAAMAAKRILQKYPDTVLNIYGYGPEKKTMERILDGLSNVFWHGFVEREEMFQALLDADILLYPSYHHGLATVILQAMQAQLPIVALEGDPIAETVKRGCGLTASGSSEQEIVDSVCECTEKMLKDPELRLKFGTTGRKMIESHYEWEILTKKMSDLYEKLLEKQENIAERKVQ